MCVHPLQEAAHFTDCTLEQRISSQGCLEASVKAMVHGQLCSLGAKANFAGLKNKLDL